MSGGSLDYFYCQLREHVGDFGDRELDELVDDLADLFHDREWYLSADDDKGDIFRWLVRNIEYEEAKKLANFFYRNRVDTIIYTGSNGDLIRAIKEEKEAFEKNPDRILELPSVPHCYGFEFEDYLHLFFGTNNYDFFGHDGYLPDDDEAKSIYLGGG